MRPLIACCLTLFLSVAAVAGEPEGENAPGRSPRQVMLEVKIVEASLSEMKKLGFAFAPLGSSGKACKGGTCETDGTKNSVDKSSTALVPGNGFASLLEALEREGVVRVLAVPTVVAQSGLPVSYAVGGEFPVPTVRDNKMHIEFKQYGTELHALAVLTEGNRVQLKIRPTVTELDPAYSVREGDNEVPGVRVRSLDTGFEMELGQTAIIGGDVRRCTSGACDAFTHEQVQTLYVVTPTLVDAPQTAAKPAESRQE